MPGTRVSDRAEQAALMLGPPSSDTTTGMGLPHLPLGSLKACHGILPLAGLPPEGRMKKNVCPNSSRSMIERGTGQGACATSL
jgi:hypothetical protein